MKSDLVFSVTAEDIKVAAEAFRLDDFEMLNILGNRIMSNCIYCEESKLALVGLFVKQLALTYLEVKAHFPSHLPVAKSAGRDYLDSLNSFSQTTDQTTLWQNFQKFTDTMRFNLISDEERHNYTEKPDFTASSFVWLLQYLTKERELLSDSNCVILKGILNEMGRIYNMHGGTLKEIYINCLVVALDRYFDYFRIRYRMSSGEIDRDSLKMIFFPFIDEILQVTSPEKDINSDKINEIILDLTQGWRLFFVQYMELTPKISKKPIELPEESKRKLSEALGKALEKEVKI